MALWLHSALLLQAVFGTCAAYLNAETQLTFIGIPGFAMSGAYTYFATPAHIAGFTIMYGIFLSFGEVNICYPSDGMSVHPILLVVDGSWKLPRPPRIQVLTYSLPGSLLRLCSSNWQSRSFRRNLGFPCHHVRLACGLPYPTRIDDVTPQRPIPSWSQTGFGSLLDWKRARHLVRFHHILLYPRSPGKSYEYVGPLGVRAPPAVR